MKYKAVLFDLDGTLLNTIDDLGNSMNNVLNRLGFARHTIESYKYFVGDGLEALVRRSLPIDSSDDVFGNAYQMMRSEYGSNWANQTKPYEGVPELLEGLSSLGIKKTVLTNKPDDTAQKVIQKFLGKYDFEIVQGARSGVPKKPNPEAALEIASKLKIDCSDFLYLGDTKIDMKTACLAGMFPIGVLWGFRKAEELIESGAKILITNPTNLLEFFNK